MIPENVEAIWQETITPEIEKFNKRSLFQSTLIKLKTKKILDNISLPAIVIMQLGFDTNRLIKICVKQAPFAFTNRLICNCYPFSASFITLAERNLRIPNFALLYDEEVPRLTEEKSHTETIDELQANLNELTTLLINDPSGFLIVDSIANTPDSRDYRTGFIYGNIINQVITQGAERYKYIYNQLLLHQTD